ncbi:MAG: hypothetical protein COC19_08630 [SAR86 cluster bacterium]|uniref:Uncharacterized protein n=1 Tax=SAR86 cluster bacterium TaxID=2030880 RepID=A0A2A4MEL5_9GAMM|nr:MAG: hypothetical protein COC19_08630 [SAR86 cluster bacterium]
MNIVECDKKILKIMLQWYVVNCGILSVYLVSLSIGNSNFPQNLLNNILFISLWVLVGLCLVIARAFLHFRPRQAIRLVARSHSR